MQIIGHRGARGLAPENTIASLKKALQHHVDEIEFDLRVTSDGVVILHHDADITDPTGHKRKIALRTYQELLGYKADLTTLQQVLTELPPSSHLYVEVKPGVPIKPISNILKKHQVSVWKSENIRLASFSYKTLASLKKALPDNELIVIENWSGVRARYRARKLKTRNLSMNSRWLWTGFIRISSRRGYRLLSYTVNDPQKAQKWRRAGLYGIVTDYPDRFEDRAEVSDLLH